MSRKEEQKAFIRAFRENENMAASRQLLLKIEADRDAEQIMKRLLRLSDESPSEWDYFLNIIARAFGLPHRRNKDPLQDQIRHLEWLMLYLRALADLLEEADS